MVGWLITLYLGTGIVFATAFVLRGAASIDTNARGAPFGFRLLIFPASCLLWPLLLSRWRVALRKQGSS